MNFFFIKNSLFPVLGHGPLPGPKLTLYVIICFWLRNFRGSQKEMVFHKKKKKKPLASKNIYKNLHLSQMGIQIYNLSYSPQPIPWDDFIYD